MLNALHYGAPPHGGIAPGIDRIVMLLAGEENLREVVLFPMNQKAEDLMMGAPSEVAPSSCASCTSGSICRRNSRGVASSASEDFRCAFELPFAGGCAVLSPPALRSSKTLKIFDAHLHYNQEPNPFYSLDKVLEIFRRNNVTGILATSRPNKGTHQLMDAKAPGLWVVPFIRPYRIRADIQTWFNDPAIARI